VVVVISDSIAKKIVVDSLKTESNAVAPDSKIFVYGVLKAYDTRTKEMTRLIPSFI
jgi:nitrogen regulatory protein PII